MIGVYQIDVFGEAKTAACGYIEVDFLRGTTAGGSVSRTLAGAVELYSKVLPDLCSKQGVDIKEVKALAARFAVDPVYGPHFTVTVENNVGKKAEDQYVGVPGRKLRRAEGERLA